MIYGGFGQKEALLDDFHVFNVENEVWHDVKNIKGALESKIGGSF